MYRLLRYQVLTVEGILWTNYIANSIYANSQLSELRYYDKIISRNQIAMMGGAEGVNLEHKNHILTWTRSEKIVMISASYVR